MFFPIRTDAPLHRKPWMNYALIGVNVLMFLAQQTVLDAPRQMSLHLDPRNLTIINFFTYQFLHGGLMHLVGNMLFLYIFGNNVNDRLGQVGYLAFYLGGGVVAGIGHVLTSTTPVLGASGSVSAITGAFLVLYPYSHTTIIYFFYLIGSIEVKSLYLILFFFLKDLVFNFVGSSNIAHMAHAFGTVFGVIVCLGLLAVHLLPRDHFDVLGLIERWNRRRQFRTQVAGGFNPFGHVSARSSSSPPRAMIEPVTPAMQQIMDLRAAIFEAMNEHRLEDAAGLYAQLKQLDAQQVLPLRNQLDLAAHLAHQQRHPQAAEAYESLLRTYPQTTDRPQIHLMLGLIYARYLQQFRRASEHLTIAADTLGGGSEAQLARDELSRIAENGAIGR